MHHNNWLEPFRQAAGYTRLALATELGTTDKTIQRWETYQTRQNIPFERLGEALGVSTEALLSAHQRGSRKHQVMQTEKETGINISRIIHALVACQTSSLSERLLKGFAVENIEEVAIGFARLISANEIDEISDKCNQPIISAATWARDLLELDKIRNLVGSIALSAVIPHEEAGKPCQLHVRGTRQAWVLRLVIDSSRDHPMTGIRVWRDPQTNHRVPVSLDNSKTRSVMLPPTKSEPGDLWSRLHEVIGNLAAEAEFTFDFPALETDDEHQALNKFCANLNRRLKQTNVQHNHCFAYTLVKEPEAVRNRLMVLLPALRLFICTDSGEAIPVLYLKEEDFEAWIANLLTAIEEREEALKDDFLPDKSEGESKMSNQARDINQRISVTAEKVTISGQTQHQYANSDEVQELKRLLETIRSETDRDNPDHQQLRADVLEILSELEKKDKLPANGKTWLEKSKATIGLGDNLVGLVTKAIELWSKFPGVGT